MSAPRPRRPPPAAPPPAEEAEPAPGSRAARLFARAGGAFERRSALAPLVVLAAAFLAQAWILDLAFQLDDFRFLVAPFEIFAGNRAAYDAPSAAGFEPFMLRWTAWTLWGLLRPLAGEPASPLPFHLAGVVLHGGAAALVTIVVRGLVAGRRGLLAGVFAGLFFGIGAGGIQAVSWTSAHPDLLATFFGLAGLALFLRARPAARGERTAPVRPPELARRAARGRLRPVAALLTLLSLLSKTPAAVVWPATAIVLAASAPDRRTRGRELVWLVAAGALAALARFLYLGTLRLRYVDSEAPSPWEAARHVGSALELLGQALFPWNRDGLFADVAPLLGGWHGLAPPVVAAVVFGAPLAVVLFRGRARGAIALAFGVAVLLALPGALIFPGGGTNVASRAAYLPLVAACAALGVAAAAAFEPRAGAGGGPRVLPSILVAAWCLVLFDGRAHVARTEVLASEHRERVLALVAEAVRATHAAGAGSLRVLAVEPDAGFAGIPGLGPHLRRAAREPFAEIPGELSFELEVYPSREALDADLPTLDLAGSWVHAIGPAQGALAAEGPVPAPGAPLREARAARPWTPLVAGWAVAPEIAWALSGTATGEELWAPSPEIPAHECGALRAVMGPGPSGEGTWTVVQGDVERRVRVSFEASSEERAVVFQPTSGLDSRLGPPIRALRWSWLAGKAPDGAPDGAPDEAPDEAPDGAPDGEAALGQGGPLRAPPELLSSPPSLRPLSPPPGAALSCAPGSSAPSFSIVRPEGDFGGARWLRLELRVSVGPDPLSLYSDVPLPPKGSPGQPVELRAERLHLEPRHAPGSPVPSEVPWAAIADGLAASLRAQSRTEAFAEWRLTTHHPTGALSAATPFSPTVLRTTPEPP